MTIAFISDDWGMEKVVLWSAPKWVGGELRFGGKSTKGMQMGHSFRVTFVGEDGVEMEAACRLLLCGAPGRGAFVAAVVAWVASDHSALPVVTRERLAH